MLIRLWMHSPMLILPCTTPVYPYFNLFDDFSSISDLVFEDISFVLRFCGEFVVTVLSAWLCPSAVHSGRSIIQVYLSSLLSKLVPITDLLFHWWHFLFSWSVSESFSLVIVHMEKSQFHLIQTCLQNRFLYSEDSFLYICDINKQHNAQNLPVIEGKKSEMNLLHPLLFHLSLQIYTT